MVQHHTVNNLIPAVRNTQFCVVVVRKDIIEKRRQLFFNDRKHREVLSLAGM